jgi:hypothetical protein
MNFGVGFNFDFNILTAFIRLGRAGPVGAGCPPYLTLSFEFDFKDFKDFDFLGLA